MWFQSDENLLEPDGEIEDHEMSKMDDVVKGYGIL